MTSKLLLVIDRLSRRLGVRVVIFAMLALLVALLAPLVDPLLPEGLKRRFDADAVLPILNILASTMLAVTTFSLGVMVQASQAASSQATPRAHRIVMADGITQTVLATFVGAFLFSLTAIVLFRAGFYGDGAPVVIFGCTVLTITLIILAILRWIDHLRRLGSMDHTLQMVEDAAANALKAMSRRPAFGAAPVAAGQGPQSVRRIMAPASGYVRFIDMGHLQSCLEKADATLWLDVRPGDHCLSGQPLARLVGGNDDLEKDLAFAFDLAEERGLEQDPRFGVMILSEIGIRALSPGLNDPGTAIDVIRRLSRVLWSANPSHGDQPKFDRVNAVPVAASELLRDAFDTLAKDAADYPDVLHQIDLAQQALTDSRWPEMAEAARARPSA